MAAAVEWRCGICGGTFPSKEIAIEHIRQSHADGSSRVVSLSTTTWSRDVHSLFDREDINGHHHQAFVFPVVPTGAPLQFIRRGTEVHLHGGDNMGATLSGGVTSPLAFPASPMHTQLTWGSQGPIVERTPSHPTNKMWRVVDAVGHKLRKKDRIKLGQYEILVRQVCLTGQAKVPDFSSVKDVGTTYVKEINESTPEVICRICMDNGDSEEDGPLIMAPCLCKTGGQHIHLGCLRQWLETRYSVTNRLSPPVEGAVALSFKPPGCEVCRTEFPATYQANSHDEPVCLFPSLPPVPPPFIVFSVPKSKDNERPHGERCVFAPGGSDALLSIGRSSDAGLMLKDVSVSRTHARVRFTGGQFVLENNNARFGTAVMIGPEQLQQEAVSFQAGRTLFQFAMEAVGE